MMGRMRWAGFEGFRICWLVEMKLLGNEMRFGRSGLMWGRVEDEELRTFGGLAIVYLGSEGHLLVALMLFGIAMLLDMLYRHTLMPL